jgi:hypothetical protein
MDGATAVESQAAAPETTAPEGAGKPSRATAATQTNLVDEAARVAATLNDKLPTLSEESSLSGNHRNATEAVREPQARDENREASGARALSSPLPEQEARVESAERAGEATAAGTPVAQSDTRGRMRQRAASVGASVGGNLRPRVEKLREASTVVFDEASDDPGLRFVIIAALLFLFFLFILLFSYILG